MSLYLHMRHDILAHMPQAVRVSKRALHNMYVSQCKSVKSPASYHVWTSTGVTDLLAGRAVAICKLHYYCKEYQSAIMSSMADLIVYKGSRHELKLLGHDSHAPEPFVQLL